MTTPQEPTVDRLVAAHDAAIDFYHRLLPESWDARYYLARRGFGFLATRPRPWQEQTEMPWQVGYAPAKWRGLTEHLTRNGFTIAELTSAGLTRVTAEGRPYDVFRNRIMFPIRDHDGRPVGFTGRALNSGERTPKYINTAETAIFHKGQLLFGTSEQADRFRAGAAPVLVEGPLDVIAVWLAHPPQAGLPRAAVAACGTNLTPHHIATLMQLPGSSRHGITLALDPDQAGRAATERAWQLLNTHDGPPLRAALLPDSRDPADLIINLDSVAILRAGLSHQARPLLEVLIDNRLSDFIDRHSERPDSPELHVAAVHAVADLLIHIPATDSRRMLNRVAEITAAGPEAIAAVIIAAFDHTDGPTATAQPPPGPRSAVSKAFAAAGHRHVPTYTSPPASLSHVALELVIERRPRSGATPRRG